MKIERFFMKLYSQKMFFALLLLAQTFFSSVFSTPMNSPQDPQPLYTVLGIDRFYKHRHKGEIRISISPFYQNANSSKNNEAKKDKNVGNRQGAWNLYGLLWGLDARPNNTNPLAANNYPNLYAAQQGVQKITTQTLTDSRYRVGPAGSTLTPPTLFPAAGGLTNELNFDPAKHPFVYLNVPLVYEKLGVRGQVNFDFGFGLGVSVKGGVVDLKQIYKPMTFESQFDLDRGATTTSSFTPSADTKADSTALYNEFMSPNVRTQIFKELGYDTGKAVDFPSYHKTGAEDLHIAGYWHFAKDFKDSAGDVTVTAVPYLSIGAWVPTGEKADTSKNILALPTGNDGYYGITADISLAFDFPLVPNNKQTLQVAIGGGALFFNQKDQKNVRFPSSGLQVGLYPWILSQMKKRPGTTWYANASIKSEEFMEGFSFFMDYIYTQHAKDRIEIVESDAKRLAAFTTGLDKYRENSMWKAQQMNIGLNYKWSSAVSCGFAVQPCLGGTRIYRTITILGGVSASF